MRSFPWDSIVTGIEDGLPILDRTYHASDLREVYKTFFSNGVFIDVDEAFQVTAVADELSVLVAPGKCNIEGTIGWDGSGRKLVLQAASSSADRIDTVVLRWNANNDIRDIDLYVKTGVIQEIPVRPQLTRNDTVYELGLCDIYVARGTSTITQQRITDTRLDKERCGAVSPLLDVDTTSFYLQLQAQTAKAVELANAALEGTIAGELQSQIDTINSDGWVTTGRISNGAVTTEKLNAEAVTSAKIADGAVGTSKLGENSVTSGKISDGAVGTSDLANGAVTNAKLDNATQQLLSYAVRRGYASDNFLAIFTDTVTASSGSYTYNLSSTFKSIAFAIAQVNESNSSIVVNACLVTGTNVALSIKKVADGTAYSGSCRVKVLVLGVQK